MAVTICAHTSHGQRKPVVNHVQCTWDGTQQAETAAAVGAYVRDHCFLPPRNPPRKPPGPPPRDPPRPRPPPSL